MADPEDSHIANKLGPLSHTGYYFLPRVRRLSLEREWTLEWTKFSVVAIDRCVINVKAYKQMLYECSWTPYRKRVYTSFHLRSKRSQTSRAKIAEDLAELVVRCRELKALNSTRDRWKKSVHRKAIQIKKRSVACVNLLVFRVFWRF